MTGPNGRIVLGTRGSPLALKQTSLVVERLRTLAPEIELAIRTVRTVGDQVSDRPISALGDKGVFVQPLADCLLKGEIDIAVHSLKDVPGDAEIEGLELAAYMLRADPRDVLISRQGLELKDLPVGSVVGTGSLRRRAQLRETRADLEVRPIRGNVDTRLRKLDAGEYDALVLAAAGLERLGLANRLTQYLDPVRFVPDPGQGILALQTLSGGDGARLARALDEPIVRSEGEAERAVARGLDADCRSPVGALARVQGEEVSIVAMAATDDLVKVLWMEVLGKASRAAQVGFELGLSLSQALAA